jgi:hypothetical protein
MTQKINFAGLVGASTVIGVVFTAKSLVYLRLCTTFQPLLAAYHFLRANRRFLLFFRPPYGGRDVPLTGEGTTWDLLYSACFQTITSGLSAVIPVVCYSNADTKKISILKENRGKSGVYR